MKKLSIMCDLMLRLCRKSLVVTGVILLQFFMQGVAHAEDDDLSSETKACLKCHDKKGEEKTLDNHEKLSLYVSTKAFKESMHGQTDCEDCHSDIDAITHGKAKTSIESKRAYTLSMGESCRECHKKNFAKYEDSIHAARVKEGSKDGRKDAPLCADCHDPHTQPSVKIHQPISATPCAKCHEDIFKAYSKDVHGLERIAKGKGAPICGDCHKTHDIKAASFGDGIKDACLGCHKNAVVQHKDWLPNAERHFAAISCPVCHAPDAKRQVNLRLYDNVGNHQISEKIGVPQFEMRAQLADPTNMGLDDRALWSLLKEFNQHDGSDGKTILRGRLEVHSGVEAHQLAEKSKALKDCNICHQYGAEPFQSVTLTIAGPDGRPLRHAIKKDVLNSMLTMNSVRGFYSTGGTRIKLLDTLLLLVVVGSIGGTFLHMTIKLVLRKVRERRAAGEIVAGEHALPGDHRSGDASK